MQIDTQELSEKFYNATVTDLQMVHEDLFVLGLNQTLNLIYLRLDST